MFLHRWHEMKSESCATFRESVCSDRRRRRVSLCCAQAKKSSRELLVMQIEMGFLTLWSSFVVKSCMPRRKR